MYVLDTDASNFTIGAVLSQMQDGEERVIAYASKALSRSERNYCVTHREMLGVVYYMRAFRQFLLGRKFLICIDHAALQWIQKTPEPIGQQARWCEIIQEFQYDIEHRAGRLHTNADTMSRRPCRQCGHEPEEETGADHFEEEIDIIRTVDVKITNNYNHIVTPQWVDAIFNNLERGYIDNDKYHCRAIHFVEPESDSIWSPQTLRDATSRDVDLNSIYNRLSSYTECPERDRLAHLDDITKTYWKQLKLEQGLIYRIGTIRPRTQ